MFQSKFSDWILIRRKANKALLLRCCMHSIIFPFFAAFRVRVWCSKTNNLNDLIERIKIRTEKKETCGFSANYHTWSNLIRKKLFSNAFSINKNLKEDEQMENFSTPSNAKQLFITFDFGLITIYTANEKKQYKFFLYFQIYDAFLLLFFVSFWINEKKEMTYKISSTKTTLSKSVNKTECTRENWKVIFTRRK